MEPSHYLVYFRGYYSPFHFQYTLIVLQDHSKAQSKQLNDGRDTVTLTRMQPSKTSLWNMSLWQQVALLCALHPIHGLSECLPCHKYQLHKAEEVLFVDLWQPVLHFAVCLLLTYAVRVSETVTQSPIIHHQWHFAESCCLMLLLAAISSQCIHLVLNLFPTFRSPIWIHCLSVASVPYLLSCGVSYTVSTHCRYKVHVVCVGVREVATSYQQRKRKEEKGIEGL